MTARQVAGLIKDRKRSLGLKEHALTSQVADADLGGVTTILGHDCSAVTKVSVVIKGTSESWEDATVIEMVGDRGVEQLAQQLDGSAPLSVETDLFSTNLKPASGLRVFLLADISAISPPAQSTIITRGLN